MAKQLRVTVPAYGWRPRDYQEPAFKAWECGALRELLIWHRRAGKDEVQLHKIAIAAHQRVGGYWHLLPQQRQARTAIWNAVNPRTGRRRIHDAFPEELIYRQNDQEMFIEFKNGSTYQLLGSDNYNSFVGSPPVGICFSEWALSDPSVWGYVEPILLENGGWASFITTPRGRNHAWKMYEAHKDDPEWFVQKLGIDDTGVITAEQVERSRKTYLSLYSPEEADMLIDQEYYCSFSGSLIGSYYAHLVANAENEGRVTDVPVNEGDVHSVWDIGQSDDTAIWCFQVVGDEIHIVDYYELNGVVAEHYCDWLLERNYVGHVFLPHDAYKGDNVPGERTWDRAIRAKGFSTRKVPNVSVQKGIEAARVTFPKCRFNKETCTDPLDTLRSYRRDWDDNKKCFRDKPVHDWTSHCADAFRYLALSWRLTTKQEPKPAPQYGMIADEHGNMRSTQTIMDMIKQSGKKSGVNSFGL